MAEVADLDTTALMNTALADVGSTLRTPVPPAAETPPAPAPPVADVEEYDEPPMDDAPEPPAAPAPPEWRQAWDQERARLVAKEDLDAVTQRLAASEQQHQTTQELLRALATQLQQPRTETPPPPTAPQPITLTQATEAFYLNGDRTLLEQYERQQSQAQHLQQAREQIRTEQQKLLVNLA